MPLLSYKKITQFLSRSYQQAVAEIQILNGGASAVNFPSLWLEVFKSTLKLPSHNLNFPNHVELGGGGQLAPPFS